MDCEGGGLAARCVALRRGTGGTLPELRMELWRDTFVLDERAIVSTRTSALGFVLGFVGDGVDGLGVDMSDEPADDERVGAEAGTGRDAGRRGGPSVKVARFLRDALRASRPLTAAPSLIQP